MMIRPIGDFHAACVKDCFPNPIAGAQAVVEELLRLKHVVLRPTPSGRILAVVNPEQGVLL